MVHTSLQLMQWATYSPRPTRKSTGIIVQMDDQITRETKESHGESYFQENSHPINLKVQKKFIRKKAITAPHSRSAYTDIKFVFLC